MVALNSMPGLYKRPIIKGLGRFICSQNELPIIQPRVVARRKSIAYTLVCNFGVLDMQKICERKSCEPSNLERFHPYL